MLETDKKPVLNENLPCRGCGYNLRGLAFDGRCPECSDEIANSITDNPFERAPTEWLKAVRSGGYMIVGSIVGGLGAMMVISIAADMMPRYLGRSLKFFSSFEGWSVVAAALVSGGIMLGVWRVTRVAAFQERRRTFLRWAARIASVAPVIAVLTLVYESEVAKTASHWSYSLVASVLPLIVLWGGACYCKYLAELIRDVGDEFAAGRVAGAATVLFVSGTLLAVDLLVFGVAVVLDAHESVFIVAMLLMGVTAFSGVFSFIFTIVVLVEQVRLSMAIGRLLGTRAAK
jgi:hypothetical protein